MSEKTRQWIADFWVWFRTAPPAAVLAIMLLLTMWVVYTQDNIHAQQQVATAERVVAAERIDKLEVKLDAANDKLSTANSRLLAILAQLEDLRADARKK